MVLLLSSVDRSYALSLNKADFLKPLSPVFMTGLFSFDARLEVAKTADSGYPSGIGDW